ncbi:MAG TPA: glycoside hydrolase family 13 protein, partial [Candidatus Limnocylindrales bacterium]|nr:glycoside hydrolase family 13 protein [Candidatus Limnocylindrales bacterium]
ALHPPRIRYRFGLETQADGLRWFGADGLRDEPRPRGAFEFAYLAEGDRTVSPDWARGAVFYHIFPDRFARGSGAPARRGLANWDDVPTSESFLGGDLDGITEHLDHIASLGVDALYLTPIFSAPSNHKYDTADYFAVDPAFGGDEALRRLIGALHERGMKLVLDGVFNHVGRTMPQFADVLARTDASPYRSWFYFDGDKYETWSTDVPALPKLRTSEPAVRDLVCRIGRHWVEQFGIDGWRLDVANEVDHALWRAFRASVREANADAYLVGEVWDLAMPWLRGDQFDAVMNYPARSAILRYAGAGPGGVAFPLEEPLDGEAFLNAVDRVRGAYPEPIHDLLYNLVGSHDEVRPLFALREDRAAAAVAAALLFTLPGIASIYYGDEVGMSGGNDPLNRAGMIWDEPRQDAQMLALYRRLGRLRTDIPALRSGSYRRLAEDGALAAFARETAEGRAVVVANASAKAVRVLPSEVSSWLEEKSGRLEILSHASVSRSKWSRGDLSLPAQSVAVVVAE